MDKLTVELHEAGLLNVNSDHDLTLDGVLALPYCDAVVKEILRLTPPVGAGYRKALQTFEIDVSCFSDPSGHTTQW